MRTRLLILIVLVAVVGAIGWFVLRQRTYDPVGATLTVQSGATTITRATTGKQESIKAGDPTTTAVINPGDSLQSSDTGTLDFSGTQLELYSGTGVTLKRYMARGSEAQIEAALQSGQIMAKLTGYADPASGLTLDAQSSVLTSRGGTYVAYIAKDNSANFGVVYGMANVSEAGHTVTLSSGQGTTMTDKTPGDPGSWSPVVVTAYRANGSQVQLPLTLTSPKSGDTFTFLTGETFILPQGQYDLALQTVPVYNAPGLTLKAGTTNVFPITLAEAIFNEVDANGNPLSAKGFILKADSTLSVAPNTPILTSPGDMTVGVASDDDPALVQPVRMMLEPGQTGTFSLRNDLFGGAKIMVDITPMPGTTLSPLTISVYSAGNENGSPVQRFHSDSASPLLAPGDYIVVVPTQPSARFPVTITRNQDQEIPIALGSLTVAFTDAQGQPSFPSMIIAASSELQRLGLTLDKMQSSSSPYALTFLAGRNIVLPAGKYMLGVVGRPDLSPQEVEVQAGKLQTIPIKASS